MKKRIFAMAMTAAVLASGLAGCTTKETAPAETTSTGTSTGTATAEPSSTYTIPPRPAIEAPAEPELTGVDVNNAYELAQFYLELYPYVKATGDTELWEKYALPECEFCQAVVNDAKADNETGAWMDFPYEILGEAGFTAQGEFDYRIDLLIDRRLVKYYGTDGLEETEPGQHTVVVGVKNVDGQLLVRYFDRLKPELFGKVDL